MTCPHTTTARTDSSDSGKFRVCELEAGHSGNHQTTYCGEKYFWPQSQPIPRALDSLLRHKKNKNKTKLA